MSAPLDDESFTNRYIQRWLAGTNYGSAQRPDPDVFRPKTRDHRNKLPDQSDPVIPTTLNLPVDTGDVQTGLEDGRTAQNSVVASHRQRRYSQENSHSRQPTNRVLHRNTDQRHKNDLKARSGSGQAEEPEAMPTTTDPFTKYAKRARHKAKPDKYEYKGEIQARKNPPNRKRKRTRSVSVGKEDFHADNIDAERVTLRPNCEQFVFSRSKMSMPLAGHDLPDLTFTKMEFLSRPRSGTQRGSAKVTTKQDRRDDNPKRSRTTQVETDTTAKNIQTRCLFAESNSCPTSPVNPNSTNILVRSSRSDGATTGTSVRLKKTLSWVRSKIDPRLEEYQSVFTNTDSATSVPRSTSPLPGHLTQAVSVPQLAATILSSQELMNSGSTPFNVKAQSVSARSSASNDICDSLTQILLKRHVLPGTTPSRQDTLDKFDKYQSLEDLKSISDKMSRRGSLDDPHRKRSNPVQNRPHVRLRGWPDPCIAHGPPSLYTDDMNQQQKYQGVLPLQSVRSQSTRGRHESTRYNREIVLSDRCPTDELYEKSYILRSTDIAEPPRTPVTSGSSYQRPNLAVQRLDNSSAWVKPPKARHERDIAADNTTHFYWKEEQQLDEFDLELLEEAKIEISQQTSLPVADLRHSSQGIGDRRTWQPWQGHLADRASRISPPSMIFEIGGFYEISPIRTRDEIEVQEKEPSLVIDRPSLQHKTSQSEFNPFKHGWMSF